MGQIRSQWKVSAGTKICDFNQKAPFTTLDSCVIHTRQLAAIPLPDEFLRFPKTQPPT